MIIMGLVGVANSVVNYVNPYPSYYPSKTEYVEQVAEKNLTKEEIDELYKEQEKRMIKERKYSFTN